MVDVVPGAVYKQLHKNYTSERWDYSLGLILHVQEGNNPAGNWFANPDCNNASSHWWVGKDGRIEQYLDPDYHQSWAQGNGNSEYHSVETEGYLYEPLTTRQIAGLATIYRFGRQKYGWPLHLANRPGEKGLGVHSMGGVGWGNHPCPGLLRAGQRHLVISALQGNAQVKGSTTMSEAVERMAADYLAGVSRGGDPRADKAGKVLLRQEIADTKTLAQGIDVKLDQILALLGRLQ